MKFEYAESDIKLDSDKNTSFFTTEALFCAWQIISIRIANGLYTYTNTSIVDDFVTRWLNASDGCKYEYVYVYVYTYSYV